MGGEGGFSLVEVLVAMVVLLVILLPVGSLLITTSQVIANGTFRTQARGLAGKEIAAVQGLVDSEPAAFTLPFGGLASSGGSPAVAPSTTAGGSPAWNTTASWTAQAVHVTAGSEVYTVYVDGNWCSAPTSGTGSLGTAAVPPTAPGSLAFVVAVDVLWNHTTLTSGYSAGTHVVATSTVFPPSGWSGITFPTPALSACPAGLS